MWRSCHWRFDTTGSGHARETALQGHPASACTPGQREDTQTEKPEGCGVLLDDGELLHQLLACFGGIPFVGVGKPKGTAPTGKATVLIGKTPPELGGRGAESMLGAVGMAIKASCPEGRSWRVLEIKRILIATDWRGRLICRKGAKRQWKRQWGLSLWDPL